MSTVSSYLISVHTTIVYSDEEYNNMAQQMEQMLHAVFGDAQTLSLIAPVTVADNVTAECEVEVEQEPEGLVGRVLLDIVGGAKVMVDKPKLTKIFRARPEANLWPNMKIMKRAAEPERATGD